MDEPQSHLAGELGRQRRHLTGAVVGLVSQVVHAVQVGAVVLVGLSLKKKKC